MNDGRGEDETKRSTGAIERPRRERAGGDRDRRDDDGDAAALRRRLAMRRARVGVGQRMALQQRQQRQDDAGADRGRGQDDNETLISALLIVCAGSASSHETAIEINGLPADRGGGERSTTSFAPPRHIARAAPAMRPASRSRRPAPGVVERHEQAGLAGPHDLAAAGNVGCDHRPAAGRGFEQALRQAFAPRRQHRDMGARPDAAMSVDMAEPGDAGLAAPACGFAARSPRRDWRDPACRRSEVRRRSRAGAAADARGSGCGCPCRSSKRPTKAMVDGPGRLGHRLQRFDVDAGARDQHDPFGGDAEREHAGAVVGVLDQHDLPRIGRAAGGAGRSATGAAAAPWRCPM